MRNTSKVILFIALVTFFVACEKNKFPIEPVITLTSFKTNNNVAVVKIRFTDGDGDVGKASSDTVPYYDFFSNYFEKQNGKFVQVITASPFSYRIPQLNRGKSKPLQGDIVIEDFPSYNPISRHDTVKFEFYIRDNAGNESNHVFTNEVIQKQAKEWQ